MAYLLHRKFECPHPERIARDRRTLLETTMSRYETVLGASMRSRTTLWQNVETALACAILNAMTHLGMPDGYCIA